MRDEFKKNSIPIYTRQTATGNETKCILVKVEQRFRWWKKIRLKPLQNPTMHNRDMYLNSAVILMEHLSDYLQSSNHLKIVPH